MMLRGRRSKAGVFLTVSQRATYQQKISGASAMVRDFDRCERICSVFRQWYCGTRWKYSDRLAGAPFPVVRSSLATRTRDQDYDIICAFEAVRLPLAFVEPRGWRIRRSARSVAR
jgi:hypothetical protein